MSENERPSYFAVISADVRYDKRLRANEKLLYGEITALCNKTGACWASNKYFADLYGVTTQAVSKWITNLRQCGYISVNLLYKEGTKEIERRIIKLSRVGGNDVTSDCKVVTSDCEVVTNDCGGIVQKVKDNNTRFNNTNEYINIKESKKEESNNTQNRQVEIYDELNELKKEIELLKTENQKLKEKKESKPRKTRQKLKSYDEQIEEYTQSEDLKTALKAFVQMRAFIKKPLTEYALKLMLKKLDGMTKDDETKTAIVNNAVEHNWQGIYPLKDEQTYSYKKPVPDNKKTTDQIDYSLPEEYARLLRGE